MIAVTNTDQALPANPEGSLSEDPGGHQLGNPDERDSDQPRRKYHRGNSLKRAGNRAIEAGRAGPLGRP